MKFMLIATAKNEGPYFWEWVAHHRMIGFDRIVIYENDSTDLSKRILRTMQRAGLIQYFSNSAASGRHQVRAYIRASQLPTYGDTDWAMALDLDEFLTIKTGDGTLDALMPHYQNADCLYVNWKLFGSGGQVGIDDRLVTKKFKLAEHGAPIAGGVAPFKSLFQSAKFVRPGVHKPVPKVPIEELRLSNGSALPQDAFQIRNYQCSDPKKRALVQVNHYMVKDVESFVLKSARGSAHQSHREIGMKYWKSRNRNQVIDNSMAEYETRLKNMMKWMDDQSEGEISRLTSNSFALHKKNFRKTIQTPEAQALYQFCLQNPNIELIV